MFNKYDSLIYFDTETTGLNAETCKIIELAAIQYRNINGRWVEGPHMDALIKLPEGGKIPDKIVELTHITDDMLELSGIPEKEALELISTYFMGKTLLIAHNIQFDINFLSFAFIRSLRKKIGLITEADYIDTLTVCKDRKSYPHKLENMIEYYNLSDQCQNSHRAIDDVYALALVTDKLIKERDDLERYINVFGYNPKYGISGKEFRKVKYMRQPYRNSMAAPNEILPVR